MKQVRLIFSAVAGALLLLAGVATWAQEEPLYFWRWGHMDGPHDSSKALGISRDGKTAVGSTVVVDFRRAWRSDIDWTIATDDGVPPLYNELQVQEDIGMIFPRQVSSAFAASDMITTPTNYDLPNLSLDWGGSTVVGTIDGGKKLSNGIQWLLPVLDSVDDGDYMMIPDFGGGDADMAMMDVIATGDGNHIIVGYGNNRRGPKAFYADTAVLDSEGLPVLKQLTITDSVYTAQTLKWTVAEAVSISDTGSTIIAGYGGTKTGIRAFVSTVLDASTDPITLESVVLPLIGGGKFSEAYAMTPDGAIIAGRCDSSKGPQACIWFQDAATLEWAVKPLGGLSKKKFNSVATGIAYKVGSDAGDLMVVGYSTSILYDSEAFVWSGNPVVEDDGIGYLYDLEYILTKTGAGEISGMGSQWILNEATGLSAAGDRIVGWGVNPEGGIEAWVVTGYPFNTPVFTHE